MSSSVFIDGDPEADASRQRSGILTPTSDGSLNRQDVDPSPALRQKRREDVAAMDQLLKASVAVKVRLQLPKICHRTKLTFVKASSTRPPCTTPYVSAIIITAQATPLAQLPRYAPTNVRPPPEPLLRVACQNIGSRKPNGLDPECIGGAERLYWSIVCHGTTKHWSICHMQAGSMGRYGAAGKEGYRNMPFEAIPN